MLTLPKISNHACSTCICYMWKVFAAIFILYFPCLNTTQGQFTNFKDKRNATEYMRGYPYQGFTDGIPIPPYDAGWELRKVHPLPRSRRKHTHTVGQTLTLPSVLILKSLMGHGGVELGRFIVSWLMGENSRKAPCWVRSAEDVVLIVGFPVRGRPLLSLFICKNRVYS